MQLTLLLEMPRALAASARTRSKSVKPSPPSALNPSCKKFRRPNPAQLRGGGVAIRSVVEYKFRGVENSPNEILNRFGARYLAPA